MRFDCLQIVCKSYFSSLKIKLCSRLFLSLQACAAFGYFLNLWTFLKKYNCMTTLFIIAVLIFIYMCYVLVKPEKF